MSSRYTHIMVDMQRYFPDANHEQTIANNARELQRAIDRNCDIIYTEIPYYSAMDKKGLPPTHRRLLELLKGYKRARLVQKLMFQRGPNMAARCVLNGCDEKPRFEKTLFRVSGVCTGGWVRNKDGSIKLDQRTNEPEHTGCVFDIVLGLTVLVPDARIKVVQDACRDTRPVGIGDAPWVVNWDDFRGLRNVTVITPDAKVEKEAA